MRHVSYKRIVTIEASPGVLVFIVDAYVTDVSYSEYTALKPATVARTLCWWQGAFSILLWLGDSRTKKIVVYGTVSDWYCCPTAAVVV